MGNWTNWLLLIIGIVSVIAEIALGAITGFDLALVGASLTIGGVIGLFASSANVGLISAAILALLYFALLRNWLKKKLHVKDQPSNVDAVVGKSGVVTRRITAREAGCVKVGSEEWRAELLQPEEAAREIGADIKVISIEGVTLKVR